MKELSLVLLISANIYYIGLKGFRDVFIIYV